MTIRFKLTMGFLGVILMFNALLSLITVKHVGQVWLQEIQNKVKLDLNSAREVYRRDKQQIARFLEGAAFDAGLPKMLASREEAQLGIWMQRLHERAGVDMTVLVGSDGLVLRRARNASARGDNLSWNPVIAQALRERATSIGTIICPREQLETEGDDLARRAQCRLVPTAATRPLPDTVQSDGMLAAVAVPIIDGDGQLLGLLYGANLLNHRFDFVDTIRDQVFPNMMYAGRHVGTVTLFQNDVRIATNVLDEDGQRALGTRLNDEVREMVLERGEVFADRVQVINHWYITAYEPIRDPTGKIVGAMYVGMLEAPFSKQHKLVISGFLLTVGITSVASLLLLFLLTNRVLRPIGRIIAMSRQVIKGDMAARVGPHPGGEMGELCCAVDAMADALAQREERLKQTTRQQISQSEKLASVGRLAAGVAHEINNPLTGVLTFAHVLREKPNMDEQDKQDLDLIIHETTRVGEIVTGLLDFARERPATKTMLDLNLVIRQTIRLVANQPRFKKIRVEEYLSENLPEVYADRNQLQQVLLNLALNAGEAMPDGGSLVITTMPHGKDVMMKVADTGCGIKREHLSRIFDPFFTTKPVGKGTGLGLSVTYGIIQQHGGVLSVESEEGKGTTFTLILPFYDPLHPDDASAEGGTITQPAQEPVAAAAS